MKLSTSSACRVRAVSGSAKTSFQLQKPHPTTQLALAPRSSLTVRPLRAFTAQWKGIKLTTPSRASPVVRAQQEDAEAAQQRRRDDFTILGGAVTLTALVLIGMNYGGEVVSAIQEVDDWGGAAGLNSGDIFGAAIWSFALYFASPWQLLLLFLGKIETERPSDWILRKLGLAANLDVDAIDYEAPLALNIATWVFIIASGIATSAFLDASLGDSTWSVSSGIGALFGAGLYEVGRPERLSVEEAKQLESQWQDFASFAEDALLPTGRCHESEIFKSFRSRFGRYRTQEALQDTRIRDMVRNWNRDAERSRTGWYRNVSLKSARQQQELAARLTKMPLTPSQPGVGAVVDENNSIFD